MKEEKLDKDTINKLKKELEKRKKQIIKDLEDITGGENNKSRRKVKFPDFGDKTDENAQEIGEYSTNLATEKVLKSTLRDIDNSLKRIEDGIYGICKYCKKSIGKKRLLARPVASACIDCKTKLQSAP
jgi:DnaK suppressor protein